MKSNMCCFGATGPVDLSVRRHEAEKREIANVDKNADLFRVSGRRRVRLVGQSARISVVIVYLLTVAGSAS